MYFLSSLSSSILRYNNTSDRIAPLLTLILSLASTCINTHAPPSNDISMQSNCQQFTLPPLPYGYDELEPVISERTVSIHYSKHHQGYLNKLNVALSKHKCTITTIPLLLEDSTLPSDILNNAGGVFNHTFYWNCMTSQETSKDMEIPQNFNQAAEKTFGSFENMKKEFNDKAVALFGSGWLWICVDPKNKERLHIVETPNQSSPLTPGILETPLKPILGIDLWEHAYYLDYANERNRHIDSWWSIINWDSVKKNMESE